MSTLGFAILGLLAQRPRTGYELAQAMRAPIGYMWTARHSQIYPELARLDAQGMAEATVVEGPGPRDTKQYRITDDGLRALEAWTDSPLDEVNRSEFMLRVRCLWLLSPERARRFIETQRATYVRRLETQAYEEADFILHGDDVDDPASPWFAQYATLRYGVMRNRDTVAWCDWLLGRLERVAAADRTTQLHSRRPDQSRD